MENSADLAEEIDTEYSVLSKTNQHPNLPEFYGAFLHNDTSPGTHMGLQAEPTKQIWIAIEVSPTLRLY